MAAPIGATPILEGKEATEWWEKVEKEQDQKLSLVPTPKLEDLRREIVASANKKKEEIVSTLIIGGSPLTLWQFENILLIVA